MEELATTGTLHRFGRSVQFFEEKCSASDLYSELNPSFTLFRT